jgi:alkylhydroperoxidase/carboxymuconolactone decarboxylase family protein YurZ
VSCVEDAERLLRYLSLNDEETLGRVLAGGPPKDRGASLAPKVDVLVRLGGLLALGASTPSLRTAVEHAQEAGATEAEIVGVLVAVAPAVGLARVVATAPKLAAAIGYEIDEESDVIPFG